MKDFDSTSATSSPHVELWIRIACSLTLPLLLVISATVGKNTKQVSDRYHLSTTPPGFFFAIWGIIYSLLIFVVIYVAVQDCWSIQIWLLLATYNISNTLWTLSFHSGRKFIIINISFIFLVISFAAMELAWIELASSANNALVGSVMGTVIRNFVAFFSGWMVAAFNLGLSIVLVYTFGMSLKTQLIQFWITAPCMIVAVLFYNIFVIGTFKDIIGIFFSMGWGLVGALITSRKQPRQFKAQ